jgi:hypothetical protein
MSPTSSNLEAMGQDDSDKKAKTFRGRVGLGDHGTSDYTNYHATLSISMAASLARQHNPCIGDARPAAGMVGTTA